MANEDYQKLLIRLVMEEFGATEGEDGEVIIRTKYRIDQGELVKL